IFFIFYNFLKSRPYYMVFDKLSRISFRNELGSSFIDCPDFSRFEELRNLDEKEFVALFQANGFFQAEYYMQWLWECNFNIIFGSWTTSKIQMSKTKLSY
ncbi:hypothetical protein M153_72820002, partial [Pseudoloma neurophilia]